MPLSPHMTAHYTECAVCSSCFMRRRTLSHPTEADWSLPVICAFHRAGVRAISACVVYGYILDLGRVVARTIGARGCGRTFCILSRNAPFQVAEVFSSVRCFFCLINPPVESAKARRLLPNKPMAEVLTEAGDGRSRGHAYTGTTYTTSRKSFARPRNPAADRSKSQASLAAPKVCRGTLTTYGMHRA